MASASAFQRNEKAKLLAQNDGPVASRLRSSYKIGNAETSQTENRGGIGVNNQSDRSIASRLRSFFKIGNAETSRTENRGGIGVNNQSDKPRQLSKNQKDKSYNSESKKREVGASTSRTGQSSGDKRTNESNDSKSKCNKLQLSSKMEWLPKNCEEYSSKTKGKQVLKTQPAMSKAYQPQSETMASFSRRTLIQNSKIHEHNKIEHSAPNNKGNTQKSSSSDVGNEKFITLYSHRLAQKPIEECPIHHIRWKGPDKTSARWNCALCGKDIACLPNENERKPSIYEENELLQFSFIRREREEWDQYSLLPETSVLPCSHVFHSMCLSAAQLIDFSDPPCPICVSMS